MHGARPLRSTRRLQNLMPSLPKWYNIAPAADGPTLVSIFDEIGMFGVSAGQFVADLKGVTGDLEVHISSPGGDIYDGLTIYNTLRQAQARGTVRVIVDGLAASAASFIAQAASPGALEIAPHAEFMIHDGFCMAIGNASDMRELADQLDRASDNIAGIYADRTGKPAAYWREKMRAETWYSDAQAVAEGLADRIHGQQEPQNRWDLSVYLHAPTALNAAPVHPPMTGTHVHGGPSGQPSREHSHDGDAAHEGVWDPDGDDDDDSTAEGDTDHDYVLPDGSPGPMASARPRNEKYSADDRKTMAGNGHAMPDGSYPIEDGEDLDNAIHAVGRGGADHDAIRRHIVKRADALGQSSKIPDNWNADGSLKDLAGAQITASIDGSALSALFTTALEGAK